MGESSFWGDFANSTLQGLGIDTGSNAAKTVANVIGQAKNSSSSPAPASAPVAAAATPAMPSQKLIFGMKPQVAAAVGVGLAVVIYLTMRRK
jgi:hypothetical protein